MAGSDAGRAYLAPITAVAPKVVVDGPAPEFEEDWKALFRARYPRRGGSESDPSRRSTVAGSSAPPK
ncbi:hypothetical protein [Mycolicibacter senuensis]|uniref:hypothetical protein n=1 Tax=Mycolicibacter senuensis TaxID=386913 RepID=UPI0014036DB5|nr:hypothetical protein [Mycolicibacter senuensis]